jgi:hypothetical protein
MSDSDVEMEASTSRANGTGLAYDPDQNPEAKRELRRNYRDLAKETEGII